MTIAQLREDLMQLTQVELLKQLALYNSLSSKGVRDEIMITLLEDELFVRETVVM